MKGAERGYTLMELILAMLIFSVVMALISVSFNRIVRSSSVLIKSAETDTGGLIGLEVMRGDLELAGFGLPWSVQGVTYTEANNGVLVKGCQDGCPQADAAQFNDDPVSDAPRAYRVGNNMGYQGSDYLVLKGSAMGSSSVSRSWCYLNYSSTGAVVKPSRSEPELKLGNKDRVVVLKTGVTAGSAARTLVTTGSNFSLSFDEADLDEYAPTDKNENFLVYGVAPAQDDGLPLHFPFNRADYYISRKTDSVSPTCNSFTGVLYKTTINHSWPTRTYTEYPILDCAADMQVVLYWDTDGNGEIDYHSEVLEEVAGSAADVRAKLKELRVYILAQQGRRDPSYLYPVTDPEEAILVGDRDLDHGLGRVWSASEMAATFGADWRNYRWKIYTIVVQPKNL